MEGELTIKARLVLVDDDLDLLQLMKIRLTREGFVVNLSHNGAYLPEIIKAENPDVILLDIQMQGINRDQICKQLKAKNDKKGIYVILISSKHDIRDIAVKCGANNSYSNPVDFLLLSEKIKNVVHR